MLYIWLGVILALIMIEIISRNYTAICFAISALFSLISINNSTENYMIQVIIFLVGGIILMIFVRPNVINYIEEYKKKKHGSIDNKKDDNRKIEEEKKEEKVIKKTNTKNTSSKTKNKSKKTKKKNANR